MFDILERISRQSVQTKKLLQELAIQSLRLNSVAPFETTPMRAGTTTVRDEADIVQDAPHPPGTASRLSVSQILFLCWLICIVALNGILLNEPLSRWLVDEIAPSNKIEATLKPLFTAAYKN
jgi:hypothetical protein